MQLLAVIELFPTRALGAFCVALGLVCVCVAVGCVLSEQLKRWASGLLVRFLALSPLNKAVLVLALAVSTVCAQKSGTNEVERLGGGGQPNQESKLLCSPSPSDFDYSTQTVTPDDIARGWQVWKVRTNETDFAMPANAVRNEDWFRFGGHSMFDFVSFGEGWTFPYGTQELARVTAMEDGGLRVALSRTDDEIRAVPCPLAALPRQSQFVHTTNGPDRVFAWQGFFSGGDTGAVVSAQVELRANGDFVTRSNAVETLCRRIEPFDYDGDGIPNDKDARPCFYDGDHYGQSEAWVMANFTNAEDILSVGYSQWVDDQVGVGLANGLYKLTATFPEVPRRTTLLTVGDLSVCVTNAGEYVFLLGKGIRYDLSVSSECGADFSAVDDIALRRTMALGAGALDVSETGGHWTVDHGRLELVVPHPLVPMAPAAYVVWYPELSVSPVTWQPHERQASEVFSALLTDVPWFVAPSYCWHTADADIVSISNETRRTAQFFCHEFGTQFWDASLRLDVTLGGVSMESRFVPGAHDPNGRVSLEIDMPDTFFVDDDDDDGDGNSDYGTVCDANDDLGTGAVTFHSSVPTNGTILVESANDRRCNVALGSYAGDRVCSGMEWGVSDATFWRTNLCLSPISTSSRFESDGIKLRWIPQPEGYEQTSVRRFTVVRPEVEPICTNWTEIVQDGVTVRRVMNPCGVAVGADAVFRIKLDPADYPDSKIVWEASGMGSVSFPEGNVGREVRVRGVSVGFVRLRIKIGDCQAEKPSFDLYVVQPKTVKLSAWIITSKGAQARTESEVREMVAVANDIYAQVGVTLDIGDRIVITNIPAAYDINKGCATNDCWNLGQLVDLASGTGGLECYFVNNIIASDIKNGVKSEIDGMHTISGIVVSATGSGVTLAHEIGHAFGMRDIYSSIGVQDGEGYMAVEGFVCQERCPNDWNGGCDGKGGAGARFYPHETFQYRIVEALLMHGEKDDVDMRADITLGSVWGYGPDATLGYQDTGYFTNARRTDDPQHQ